MKKKFPPIVLFSYSILLLIGGYLGHVKSGSQISLITGTISATLVMIAAIGFYREKLWGKITGFGTTSLLLAFFTYRYFLTGKFLPPGLLSLITLAVLAYLFFSSRALSRSTYS